MKDRLIIELQNLPQSESLEKEILQIAGEDIDLQIKNVNNLTGLETYIIMVSAQLTVLVIKKITEQCFKTYGVRGKVRNMSTGQEYDIPNDIDKLKSND